MSDSLWQAAQSAPDRIAIIDDAGRHSYGKLLAAAVAIRDRLLVGEAGDDLQEARVAFLIRPGFDYVATLWGVWAAGGIAVPMGLQHPLPELEYVAEDTGARLIVADESLAGRAQELAERRGMDWILLPLEKTGESAGKPEHEDSPAVAAAFQGKDERRALILYTSGSTGRPKGVVTTHANIAAQVESLIEAWQWSADDRILHVLPLHHIHGIVNVLLCALRAGATCEFAQPFDAGRVWGRLASGEMSLFMAVPTIYAKLAAAFDEVDQATQRQWSRGARAMRLHVSGSAALPVAMLERWETITSQRLLERYGMTEIGMALSNPYEGIRRPGCVGSPLPDVEARRTRESGEPADPGEPGEIEVRGPTVFLEYWRREQETRESFRDGWFRTGDIAVEDDGVFRILGRSSVDIIKTGGYKVSALEIEEVLRRHPAIEDCAVVGVPDEQWGERVAACVVADERVELAALRDWARELLAPYKLPSLLESVDALPRNAMGKVQKPRVRELFSAATSEPPDEADEQDGQPTAAP